MKERPILFSGEMVRAILDGRKTQTRRVIKPQPFCPNSTFHFAENIFTLMPRYMNPHDCNIKTGDSGNPFKKYTCPYGTPGDRLWVRETFCIESSREVGLYEPPFKDGRPCRWHEDDAWGFYWEQPHYKATDPTPELEIGTGDPGVKWSPSIHMPRWASRIMLEIVSVRVERVQEISRNDGFNEGVETRLDGLEHAAGIQGAFGNSQLAFAALWDSINAKRGFGWNVNPWVWIIEFKKL